MHPISKKRPLSINMRLLMFILLCSQKYWNCSTIKISHKKIQHGGFNIEEDRRIFMIFFFLN